MSERRAEDEALLIDFVLGRCDDRAAEELSGRLSSDADLRRLHDDIAHTLSALALAPEPEPPADLADKTLARVRTARQTDALVAREELHRPAVAPTFSLRELGALAAAMLLLAIIFVPSVRTARFRAAVRRCQSHAGQVGTALLSYANTNDGALPYVDGSGQRWLPGADEPAASNSAALFKLVRGGYAPPGVFQCPGRGAVTFVVQADLDDFPAPEFIGYSYQHRVGPNRMAYSHPRMVILADSTPVFDAHGFHKDRVHAQASDNHDERGQTVLYLGGDVGWVRSPGAGVEGDNIFLVKDTYDYEGVELPRGPTDTFLLPAYVQQK